MAQKALLWLEVGKSVCVLVGICGLRLSLPARYGTLYPSLWTFPVLLWVDVVAHSLWRLRYFDSFLFLSHLLFVLTRLPAGHPGDRKPVW